MRYLPVFLLALISHVSIAQDLIKSRQTSYYTYIFRLDDKEARTIYKKNIWQVDETCFHTMVDSFPTDSIFINNLPAGHYLKVHSEGNKLKFDITSVQDFDVMIAKNNTDLALQVYGPEGKLVPDADLRIGWKNIRFDKKSQSYLDRKSNRKGFLRVTYRGFTAYYDLSRQYNNSALKRTTRKLVYGTPVKYIWMPVRYVIYLPIDGVKSIARGWPQGTIQRTGRFFEKSFYKIACLFDDYYCDYYGSYEFQNKHKGYLVFNKPKYKPGDTVKIKAFIVNQKGRPVKSPVDVFLQRPGKNIKLASINPYREGAYSYEFFLHDSLELQLDRDYRIWMEKKPGKEYINRSFHYEDYELKSLQLELEVESRDHYKDSPAVIRAKGTDENDLNVLDGRMEVFVKPVDLYKTLGSYVFIPDTITFWKMELDKEKETEILIPDSVFPEANMSYEVAVTLFTSDNERITKREKLKYYAGRSELVYELKDDSLEFSYELNGKNRPFQARISGFDNFGNQTSIWEGDLPVKLKINPYFSNYSVDGSESTLNAWIDLASESSLIQCFSERTRDSIHLMVKNPRDLPFSYYIYKKDSEKYRGYTDSLNMDIRSSGKQNYFVSIQYLWGGQLFDENYQIPYKDKKLQISVLEPKVVYPSQTTNIELLVTDQEGKPVPDVDLTAYSITKKFNYSAPTLPYLGKQRKHKTIINNFTFPEKAIKKYGGLDLDYPAWKLLAGLDSIEHYKFIYPGNEIYQYRYDSDITQVAPFVVSKGAIEPVHVVYIDSKPVYFSWSTHTQPYSFRIDTGYHHLKLRTTTKTIHIDSLYIQSGKKTIISVWDSIAHPQVSIAKAESRLSYSEKRVLYKYIFPYQYKHGEYYGYIQQNGQVQFLKPRSSGVVQNLAGPVSPKLVRFHLIDRFSTDFIHEPEYEYEFKPGLLKMRSVDPELRYPEYLDGTQPVKSLTDQVITSDDIHKGWKEYLDWKRFSTARYSYPRGTSVGRGKMIIDLDANAIASGKQAINILLFKNDDHQFLRVYPGNNLVYNELAEGYYKLLFFYAGSEYGVVDSLFVAQNGENYHSINSPEVIKKDSFSIVVSKLIEDNLFKPKPHDVAEEAEVKQIFNRYQQEFKFTGEGDVIEGYVYDDENTPLPGVNVVVMGTTFGTVTDLEGYYSLNVPRDRNKLLFSYIGFVPEEVDIVYNNQINVHLTEDVMRLEEVVVTAYGVQKNKSLTASVSSLSGKVAGVSFIKSASSDDVVAIAIRGNSTMEFEATPLFMIDNSVFDGDISDLDPNMIQDIEVVKAESAIAIYGSRAAHGVVLINTGGRFKQTSSLAMTGADYDETFLEAALKSSSIRNDFSDYAFWQPSLRTNAEGKASFTVQFPDDVTSWETYYLAMNDKRQTGQTEGLIKAYKPLMAQLAVPRFLLENDTTYALGKVLNYTRDSLKLSTKFEIDEKLVSEKRKTCVRSIVDTLELTAGPDDSLSVKFYLEKEDGYFDGEQRSIPVYPIGLEETKGQFHVLDRDTALNLKFNPVSDSVTFYARADVLDVIDTEISKLIHYKYSCNEQLASKLKALLTERNICEFQGKSFKKRSQVNKVIRLLTKNQLEDGMWGWWKTSRESSLWISVHVLEALVKAGEMGYRVNFDAGQIAELLVWELESKADADKKLRALRILKLLNSKVNYPAYITKIEKTEQLSVNQLFRMIELKQLCGLEYQIDTLDTYQKQTIFGNLYYASDSSFSTLLTNDIQNTLIAYRIIRADSTSDNNHALARIRNYLYEQRANGSWLNTYESARIIETILPDLLAGDSEIELPSLQLSGAVDRTVDEFPFEISVASADSLVIIKEGDYPVYITAYQHFWNPAPVEKESDFEINTHFDSPDNARLIAGTPIKLIVNLKVKKDSDYLMINVPIPAGCSYGDKSGKSCHEVHREYFRNETSIFCEALKEGDYEFKINLIPRYSGRYTLNPAKVEMMYFPSFNANNSLRKVIIHRY
ncbi:MAG: carboxypeptidase-like regulatory domain-containing protein [Bacteroidota bacterium]